MIINFIAENLANPIFTIGFCQVVGWWHWCRPLTKNIKKKVAPIVPKR